MQTPDVRQKTSKGNVMFKKAVLICALCAAWAVLAAPIEGAKCLMTGNSDRNPLEF